MKTNVIVLSGGLTRDPESKFTPDGKQVVSFSIGTETGTKSKPHSSYFNCVAWEKTAELIFQYLKKGSQCTITGKIKQERWEKDGVKRDAVKITVREVEFHGKPEGHGGLTPKGERNAGIASDGHPLSDATPPSDDMPGDDSIPF